MAGSSFNQPSQFRYCTGSRAREALALESWTLDMFARPLVRSAPKTMRAARAAQPLSIVLFEVWPQQL